LMGCPLIELDASWRLDEIEKPPYNDWEYKWIWIGLGGIMICCMVLVVLIFFRSNQWKLMRSLMKPPPKRWDPRHAWPWDPNAPSISSDSSSSISRSRSDTISSLELPTVNSNEGRVENPRTAYAARKSRIRIAPTSDSVVSFPSIGSQEMKSAKGGKAKPKNLQIVKTAGFKRPNATAKDIEISKKITTKKQ